ncbi:hypothetical protein [Kouleothrix sp.]|uniref:hypothetical protein n=1 Tax=Kouleothrix sp. TaxID=2779161 RepID=UPI0039193AE7
MMTWNYRVFRENEHDYVIREVFYADDGTILGCTAEAVEPFGQSIDELARSIEDLKAALKLPVLTFDDIPQSDAGEQSRKGGSTVRQEDIRATLGLENASAPRKSQSNRSRRKTA